MGNETFLHDLRDEVKAFTEADPYFNDVEILNEDLNDFLQKLDLKLAQLNGVCILLVTPSVGGVLANVTGANFTNIVVLARIYQSNILNDTGLRALDVACYLAALWSQARPDTFSSALVPAEPTITLGNDPKYLSYDVVFTTESGTKIPVSRLALPVVNAANLAAITLTHATPGAAIFYTTNGTRPTPRNGTLYTAPFSASSGASLRTRAWLAGYIPSEETRQTL